MPSWLVEDVKGIIVLYWESNSDNKKFINNLDIIHTAITCIHLFVVSPVASFHLRAIDEAVTKGTSKVLHCKGGTGSYSVRTGI